MGPQIQLQRGGTSEYNNITPRRSVNRVLELIVRCDLNFNLVARTAHPTSASKVLEQWVCVTRSDLCDYTINIYVRCPPVLEKSRNTNLLGYTYAIGTGVGLDLPIPW